MITRGAGREGVQELLKLNFFAKALTTPAFPLFPARELSKRKPKMRIAELAANKLLKIMQQKLRFFLPLH